MAFSTALLADTEENKTIEENIETEGFVCIKLYDYEPTCHLVIVLLLWVTWVNDTECSTHYLSSDYVTSKNSAKIKIWENFQNRIITRQSVTMLSEIEHLQTFKCEVLGYFGK